ncbi:uncharacterized protein LOC127526402 [Erpetoichthys calabaricus]|uniref:uncharacterized protein LOC127526402 n=1 Tax=Erpetoichthys calabaricus TaxID=27687 RepID=UPI0022341185|nr:uncharacterized protein LOC127526402 [Erpetoichthys calabaricus]
MSQPAHLRVILSDHDVQKLALPSGIPKTVNELHSAVQAAFGISEDFCLHYMDVDFCNNYFTLLSTSDIKDKDTIKVVYMLETPTVTLALSSVDSPFSVLNDSFSPPSDDACSSVSSTDTLPVSPRIIQKSPAQRSKGWPSEFPIPRFSVNTELLLQLGNEKFHKDGTLFSTKDLITILPDILGRVAEGIYEYTAYPSSAQISQVAEALINKHPCLKEPGSLNRCYGWIQRLKYKMNNFRSKLRGFSCPEIEVNSLKRKAAHEQAPAKNVKKPKKAEVNYLPPYPQGETSGSLEKERVDLLHEVMKRDNCVVVAEKMAKTFSLRRQEIIYQAPAIKDIIDRWPALFDATQINEEFKRITTVSLESTFMAKLDACTSKLMDVVSSRGGTSGLRIRHIKNQLLENNTIEVRREVAIRCLVVYLGEKEQDLFKEFNNIEEFEANLDRQVLNIAIIKDKNPNTGTILIEGAKILDGIDVPRCCALLMGLIYALNLSYPKDLKCTYEVFQKLFLELDGLKTSGKLNSSPDVSDCEDLKTDCGEQEQPNHNVRAVKSSNTTFIMMTEIYRLSKKHADDLCTIEESPHVSGADGDTASVPQVRAEKKVNLRMVLLIFSLLLVAAPIFFSIYYFIKLNHKEQELEELRIANYNLTSNNSALQSQYTTLNKKHEELTKEFSKLQEYYCDGTNTSHENTCILCKLDWIPFGSKCYFISTKTKTWHESHDWCLTKGGQLVNIENSEEWELLELPFVHYVYMHFWSCNGQNGHW